MSDGPPPRTTTDLEELQEIAETLAEIAGQALAKRDAANEISETWSCIAIENAMHVTILEIEIEQLRCRVLALGGDLP